MFAPFLCLSLFAVFASASVGFHGVLELPRAIQSLTESQRVKRQISSDSANQCILSCAGYLASFLQASEQSGSNGYINRRLYDLDNFNPFCEEVVKWKNCSRACPDSLMKVVFVPLYQSYVSLCGEDRQEFESHQACYQQSDADQNQVCDPQCPAEGWAAPTKVHLRPEEENKKLKSDPVAAVFNALSPLFNMACQRTSCQVVCRIPVIYKVCRDKKAALFIGRWVQKSIKDSLAPLAGLGMDIQCDDILNFNLDKFDFDEEEEADPEEEKTTEGPMSEVEEAIVEVSQNGQRGSEQEREMQKDDRIQSNRLNPQTGKQKYNLAPKSAVHSLFLIFVSMVFAVLFV